MDQTNASVTEILQTAGSQAAAAIADSLAESLAVNRSYRDLQQIAAYSALIGSVLPVISWLRRRIAVSLILQVWAIALFGSYMVRAEHDASKKYWGMRSMEWDLLLLLMSGVTALLVAVYVYSLNSYCLYTLTSLGIALWLFAQTSVKENDDVSVSLQVSSMQIAFLVLACIPARLSASRDSRELDRRRAHSSIYGPDKMDDDY